MLINIKALRDLAGKLVFCTGIVFALLLLQKGFGSMEAYDLKVQIFPFVFSTLLLAMIFLMNALGWHLINNSLEIKSTLFDTTKIWILSSLSRYIPGVIWGYANRTIFLKEKKASVLTITLSFSYESIFLALSSILVGSFLVFYHPYFIFFCKYFLNYKSQIIFLAIFFIAIFIGAIYFSNKKNKSIFTGFLNYPKLIPVFAYYCMLWVVFVFAFGLFASSIYINQFGWANIVEIGLCFCLAFGCSYILVVFPSGIGVREFFLYALLSVIIDTEIAALISILSRVWIIFVEISMVLLVGLVAWVYKKSK